MARPAGALALALLMQLAAGRAPAAPPGGSPAERALLHRIEHGEGSAAAAREAAWRTATGRLAAVDSAGACPHSFDALHYRLALAFDLPAKRLAGEVELTALAREEGLGALTLNLVDTLAVDSVLADGELAAFSHAGDTLAVTLPAPAGAGDTLRLEVFYQGTPANEGSGGFGGFWFTPQVAFSMGVGLYTDPPSMARAWFPCYDEPCDKATVELALTVPQTKMAVANGLLTSVVEHPESGTVTYTWEHDYAISTYLIAVAISNYVQLVDETYPWISYYVYPALVDEALVSFSDVHRMMDCYVENYAPYPYDKFAYMTASKGDMEHQTCVTHLSRLVNGWHNYDYILAHELSHMWWGDGVTVADWRDVWLSEGFATWSEALYFGWRDGPAAYASYMQSLMSTYLASGELGPIYDPDPVWGATSYEKGACVLHMLRHLVGDTSFFGALHAHWSAHAYGNHVTPDFQATVEAVSGQDLDAFFQDWIYSPGYPVYHWSWWSVPLEGGQHLVTVEVDQVQSVGPVFRTPVDLTVQTATGDTTVVAHVVTSPFYAQCVVSGEPTGVLFDPGNWVLKQATQVPAADVAAGGALAGSPLLGWSAAPNPTRGDVLFRLRLGGPSSADVVILDATGRRVRRLGPVSAGPGEAVLSWDGRDENGRPVGAGVYLARCEAGVQTSYRKLVLVR